MLEEWIKINEISNAILIKFKKAGMSLKEACQGHHVYIVSHS